MFNRKEYQHRWWLKNRKRLKAQRKKWYNENREAVLRQQREYLLAHPLTAQKIRDRGFKQGLKQAGWTFETYSAALKEQRKLCAICGKPNTRRRLCGDHEHTNPPKPRGLLCDTCNGGLGFFKDDQKLLLAAHKYLRKWSRKAR